MPIEKKYQNFVFESPEELLNKIYLEIQQRYDAHRDLEGNVRSSLDGVHSAHEDNKKYFIKIAKEIAKETVKKIMGPLTLKKNEDSTYTLFLYLPPTKEQIEDLYDNSENFHPTIQRDGTNKFVQRCLAREHWKQYGVIRIQGDLQSIDKEIKELRIDDGKLYDTKQNRLKYVQDLKECWKVEYNKNKDQETTVTQGTHSRNYMNTINQKPKTTEKKSIDSAPINLRPYEEAASKRYSKNHIPTHQIGKLPNVNKLRINLVDSTTKGQSNEQDPIDKVITALRKIIPDDPSIKKEHLMDKEQILEGLYGELRSLIHEHENTAQNLEKQITQLKDDSAKYADVRIDADIGLTALSKHTTAKELEISALINRHNEEIKTMKELTGQINSLGLENTNFSKEINDLKETITRINEKNASFESEYVVLKDTIQNQSADLEKARSQIAEIKDHNKVIEEHNERLVKEAKIHYQDWNSQHDNIKKIRKEVEEKNTALQVQPVITEQIKGKLDSTEKSLIEEQKKSAELNNKINSLTSQLSAATSANNDLAALNVELDHIRTEKNKSDLTIEKLKTEFTDIEKHLILRNQEVVETKTNLDKLSKEIESLKTEGLIKDETSAQVKRDNLELIEQISIVNARVEEQYERVRKLELQTFGLQDIDGLIEKLALFIEPTLNLQDVRGELSDVEMNTSKKIVVLSNLCNTLTKNTDDNAIEVKRLNDEIRKNTEENEKKSTEIIALRTDSDQSKLTKLKLFELEEQIKLETDKNNVAQKTNVQQEELISELEDNLVVTQSKITELESEILKAVKSASQQTIQADKEINNYQNNINALQKMIVASETQIATLMKENGKLTKELKDREKVNNNEGSQIQSKYEVEIVNLKAQLKASKEVEKNSDNLKIKSESLSVDVEKLKQQLQLAEAKLAEAKLIEMQLKAMDEQRAQAINELIVVQDALREAEEKYEGANKNAEERYKAQTDRHKKSLDAAHQSFETRLSEMEAVNRENEAKLTKIVEELTGKTNTLQAQLNVANVEVAKVTDLTKQLAKLNEQLEAQGDTLTTTETKLQTTTNELNMVSEEKENLLKDAAIKNKELEQEIQGLKETMTAGSKEATDAAILKAQRTHEAAMLPLQARLAETDKKLIDITSKHTELETTVTENKLQAQGLQTALDNMKTSYGELENKLEEADQLTRSQSDENTVLLSQVEKLKNEFMTADKTIATLGLQLNASIKLNDEQAVTINKLEYDKNNLLLEVGSLKGVTDNLTSKLDKVAANINIKKDQVTNLEGQLANREKELAKASAKITVLEGRIERKDTTDTTRITALEENLANAVQQKKVGDEAILLLTGELKTEKNKHGKTTVHVAELTASLAKAEEESKTGQAEVVRLTRDLETANEQYKTAILAVQKQRDASLEDQRVLVNEVSGLQAAQSEVLSLKDKLASSQNSLANAHTQIGSIQKELGDITKTNLTLRARVKNNEGLTTQLKDQMTRADREQDKALQLNKKLNDTINQNRLLQVTVTTLENKTDALLAQVGDLNTQVLSTNQKLEQVTGELERAQIDIASEKGLVTDLKSKLATQVEAAGIAEARMESQRLMYNKEKLSAVDLKKYETDTAGLNKELLDAKSTVLSLSEKLTSSHDNLESIQNKLEGIKNKNEELITQVQGQGNDNDLLTSQLNEQKHLAEIAGNEAKVLVDQLKAAQEQNSQLQDQVNTLSTQHNEKLEKGNDVLSLQVKDLSDQLSKASIDIKSKQGELGEINTQLTTSTEKLTAALTNISRLEASIATEKASHEVSVKVLKASLADAERQQAGGQKAILQLTHDLDTEKQKDGVSERRVAELMAKLEEAVKQGATGQTDVTRLTNELKTENSQHQTAISVVKAEQDKLTQGQHMLETQVRELQASLENKTKENLDLVTDMVALRSTITTLNAELGALRVPKDAEAEIELLQKSLQEANNLIGVLKSSQEKTGIINQVVNEEKDKDAIILDPNKQLDTLRAPLTAGAGIAHLENNSQLDALRAVNAGIKAQIKPLEEKPVASKMLNKSLEAQPEDTNKAEAKATPTTTPQDISARVPIKSTLLNRNLARRSSPSPINKWATLHAKVYTDEDAAVTKEFLNKIDYKVLATINCQVTTLNDDQLASLMNEGIKVKTSGGMYFTYIAKDEIPKVILTKEGAQKIDGETSDSHEKRSANLLMEAIEKVLSKTNVVNVRNAPPLEAAIAHIYIEHLKKMEGQEGKKLNINSTISIPWENIDVEIQNKALGIFKDIGGLDITVKNLTSNQQGTWYTQHLEVHDRSSSPNSIANPYDDDNNDDPTLTMNLN